MKLLVVVQRYGAGISGGAELHARHLAGCLARFADVRVLTTCAENYVTWANALPAGEDRVDGIPVERVPVAREREVAEFGRRSRRVFDQTHSVADELAWMDTQGPTSPALVERVRTLSGTSDFVLFFCARYYQSFHGCRAVPQKAVLVPTAEREPSMGLSIVGQVFRGVRAVMYNSPEERAMIEDLTGNAAVPGTVVGVGVDVDRLGDAARFRAARGIDGPYLLYVGRIDRNKGCEELFGHFLRFARAAPDPPTLVLLGSAVVPVPDHPRVRHLGFVSDAEKLDALAGAAALVMPSPFESLSMVVLEAWTQGRPVLVNGHCEVLVGQCLRANGGLYYRSGAEFAAALQLLLDDGPLAARLGRNGRAYCGREYAWPVVERKYRTMLDTLRREPRPAARMEPLAGWLTRRRRVLPPAAGRVAAAATSAEVRQELS
ncbi:MAG: glycosyltransferase family 4 protein [Vicinamibacterales bacterium]